MDNHESSAFSPEDFLRQAAERRVSGSDSGNLAADLQHADLETLIRQLVQQRHELQVHQIELELQNEELVRANLELDVARRQYTDLFDRAPVGYLTLDPNGLISMCNLQAARQLGMDPARLRGRRFAAFLDQGSVSSSALFLRRLGASREPQRVELELLSAAGPARFVQVEGETLPDVPGQPGVSCHLVLTDISAQRRAQDEVLRLNSELEGRVEQRTRQLRDLNSELETMMYAVTHDLQAPLRQIRGFAQALIQHVPLGEDQQRYMDYIEQSSQQMDSLLFALQEYFRAGQQRLRTDTVNLERVVGAVWREYQAAADGRELVFTHDPLPQVQGDALALKMIFSQLIDNALKFTAGEAVARVHVCVRLSDQDYLLCVRDNGVGFNMRQKDRLFGVFQRLHRARDFGGVGMGLALVRRLVHRHGGRVWAEGVPDQGATFHFSIPRSPEPLRDSR